MKKTWVSILALSLVLIFTACSFDGDPTINPDPVVFLTDEDPGGFFTPGNNTPAATTDPNAPTTTTDPNAPTTTTDPSGSTPRPLNPGETSTRPPNLIGPGYEPPPTDDETTKRPPNNSENPTTPVGPTPLAQPQSNAEIAAFYNNATKKVNSLLPTYKKTLNTTVDDVNGIEPLEELVNIIPGGKNLINPRDEIGKNLGEGTKVSTCPRGEDRDYLLTGSLTANDLTGASCQKNGDYYYITLNVKNSTNPEHNRGASISRFTTDYVSGSQARSKIENLVIMGIKLNATMSSLTLKTKNVQVTAKINVYTGRPAKIQHKFGFDVEMLDVKGGALGIKKEMPVITGAGHTLVDYDNFLY